MNEHRNTHVKVVRYVEKTTNPSFVGDDKIPVSKLNDFEFKEKENV